jgi:hypothetical protein
MAIVQIATHMSVADERNDSSLDCILRLHPEQARSVLVGGA